MDRSRLSKARLFRASTTRRLRRRLRHGMPWILALCLLLTLGPAGADKLTLTLGTTTIGFPDANPVSTASIPALQNPVAVQAHTAGNGVWTLTVLANGPLTAGASMIPVNQITWTAAGEGFVSGTMSSSLAQVVGTGAHFQGKEDFFGTFSFFLANSWNFAVGAYTQTAVYTLVSL
jgi:hypothetical protein